MIPGYLREAGPDEWPDWPRPKGYRLVVVDALVTEDRWQLADPGRLCRFLLPGRIACKRPAVVQLLRPTSGRKPVAWGYCDNPEHVYGRRFVDGRLESARLVDEGATP